MIDQLHRTGADKQEDEVENEVKNLFLCIRILSVRYIQYQKIITLDLLE
jgi:hypothetical protein